MINATENQNPYRKGVFKCKVHSSHIVHTQTNGVRRGPLMLGERGGGDLCQIMYFSNKKNTSCKVKKKSCNKGNRTTTHSQKQTTYFYKARRHLLISGTYSGTEEIPRSYPSNLFPKQRHFLRLQLFHQLLRKERIVKY